MQKSKTQVNHFVKIVVIRISSNCIPWYFVCLSIHSLIQIFFIYERIIDLKAWVSYMHGSRAWAITCYFSGSSEGSVWEAGSQGFEPVTQKRDTGFSSHSITCCATMIIPAHKYFLKEINKELNRLLGIFNKCIRKKKRQITISPYQIRGCVSFKLCNCYWSTYYVNTHKQGEWEMRGWVIQTPAKGGKSSDPTCHNSMSSVT